MINFKINKKYFLFELNSYISSIKLSLLLTSKYFSKIFDFIFKIIYGSIKYFSQKLLALTPVTFPMLVLCFISPFLQIQLQLPLQLQLQSHCCLFVFTPSTIADFIRQVLCKSSIQNIHYKHTHTHTHPSEFIWVYLLTCPYVPILEFRFLLHNILFILFTNYQKKYQF